MSMRLCSVLALAAVVSVALALAACGSDKPTRLYVLSAEVEKSATTSSQGVAIGVGPITLPKYLDRPQIVTAVSGNQLSQANFDQWGGDLDDNITRVLATNLSYLLGTERVSLYPWKDRAPIDYQITLDVTKFEEGADGNTVLTVFWSIVNPSDGTVLQMHQSTYRDAGATGEAGTPGTVAGPRPYNEVVAAMSRDLGSLSRDVAAAIAALKPS